MNAQHERLTGKYKGSEWIEVNQSGKAACPYCQKLSWNSGANDRWGPGCLHVVGPGTVDKRTAIIFNSGENK